MKPWEIVGCLYTEKDSKWLLELEENEIQPMVINRYIGLNPKLRNHARILDKYTFTLPHLMWLSLAWSALPKYNKAPFIKYISKKDESIEFDFILNRIRKYYKLSDNDYTANKSRLLKFIKADKVKWFRFYGVEKTHWKRYRIDFNLMGESDKPKKRVMTLGDYK